MLLLCSVRGEHSVNTRGSSSAECICKEKVMDGLKYMWRENWEESNLKLSYSFQREIVK